MQLERETASVIVIVICEHRPAAVQTEPERGQTVKRVGIYPTQFNAAQLSFAPATRRLLAQFWSL